MKVSSRHRNTSANDVLRVRTSGNMNINHHSHERIDSQECIARLAGNILALMSHFEERIALLHGF